uniref:Glutamine amidotransferase domain-containing protein n=1 Tax=Chenopodium quinoa TaxID=63459 RepID=A0A803LHR7_CHEQI
MEVAASHTITGLCSSSTTSPVSGYGGLFLQQRVHVPKKNIRVKSPTTFSIRAVAGGGDNAVTLLDYGAGNVRSLRNAIRRLGFDIKDVQTPDDIVNANRLIFPGVGAFAAAMNVLNEKGKGLRVPHIGWNSLQIEKDAGILEDVASRHVYFVHSYRAMPSHSNEEWVTATCDYGDKFIASVRRGNVNAVQFHPEKSGGKTFSFDSGVDDYAYHSYGFARYHGVIACLDVRANDKGDLVVTKGDQYDVREQTVELAGQYYEDGADEISFLNITGFRDFPLGDLPMLQVLRFASENVFVPLTVGGGIRDFTDANGRHYTSLEVASEYFRSGADKISIGSDAVYAAEEYLLSGVKSGRSSLEQISQVYGNQAVVVSIDPRRVYINTPNDVPFKSVKVTNPGPNGETYAWYQCTVNGGREGRPIGAYELAKAVQELGAGEILLNCIDCDGQGKGFDIDLVNLISDAVSIPVIASSGAGSVEHFSEVFKKTNASAALAAGIFHRKEVPVQSVKEHLLKEGIEVRM